MRFNHQSNILSELIKALSNVKSLRNLKINGKDMLLRKGLDDHENLLENLGSLSQITSLNLKGDNETIDPVSWNLFSQSLSKFTQLQVLIFSSQIRQITIEDQNSINFEGFFKEMKTLENLEIFRFEMYNYTESLKNIGSQVFPAFCQSLQSLKRLEQITLSFPWDHSANADINQLTTALPNLQRLQDFYLRFHHVKTSQPVENNVLARLSSVLRGLKEIKSFKINMELKDVCELTYEVLFDLCKHFEQRKANLELSLESGDQLDEEVYQKLQKLRPQIQYRRKFSLTKPRILHFK